MRDSETQGLSVRGPVQAITVVKHTRGCRFETLDVVVASCTQKS